MPMDTSIECPNDIRFRPSQPQASARAERRRVLNWLPGVVLAAESRGVAGCTLVAYQRGRYFGSGEPPARRRFARRSTYLAMLRG
jgi:hypothetical protein